MSNLSLPSCSVVLERMTIPQGPPPYKILYDDEDDSDSDVEITHIVPAAKRIKIDFDSIWEVEIGPSAKHNLASLVENIETILENESDDDSVISMDMDDLCSDYKVKSRFDTVHSFSERFKDIQSFGIKAEGKWDGYIKSEKEFHESKQQLQNLPSTSQWRPPIKSDPESPSPYETEKELSQQAARSGRAKKRHQEQNSPSTSKTKTKTIKPEPPPPKPKTFLSKMNNLKDFMLIDTGFKKAIKSFASANSARFLTIPAKPMTFDKFTRTSNTVNNPAKLLKPLSPSNH